MRHILKYCNFKVTAGNLHNFLVHMMSNNNTICTYQPITSSRHPKPPSSIEQFEGTVMNK